MEDGIVHGGGSALAYATNALKSVKTSNDDQKIVVDIETTSVSPHTGTLLGIALSTRQHQGIYVSIDIVNNHIHWFHDLFMEKLCIFHNSKFDTNYLETEMGFVFPKYEDTMLLHYLIDENPGTHGLKQLAMKFTKFGDYEKPMYDWIDNYRKEKGVLKNDFTWDSIPFEIMKTYAAMDAVVTFQIYEKFVKIKQTGSGKTLHNISSYRYQKWENHFKSIIDGAILSDTKSKCLHFWIGKNNFYKSYICGSSFRSRSYCAYKWYYLRSCYWVVTQPR